MGNKGLSIIYIIMIIIACLMLAFCEKEEPFNEEYLLSTQSYSSRAGASEDIKLNSSVLFDIDMDIN